MKIVGPKNVLLLKHLFLLDSWCQAQKKSEVVVTSSRTSICFWLNFFWPLKLPGLVRTKMASYFFGAATGTIQLWSWFTYTDCSSTVWIANAYEIWLRGTSWPRNIPCSNDMQDHWSQIPGLVPAISFQVHIYAHTYVLIYIYIYVYICRETENSLKSPKKINGKQPTKRFGLFSKRREKAPLPWCAPQWGPPSYASR